MKAFLRLKKQNELEPELVTSTLHWLDDDDVTVVTVTSGHQSLPCSPANRKKEANSITSPAVNKQTSNLVNGFATPPTGLRKWKYSNSERRPKHRKSKEMINALSSFVTK